MLSEPYEYKSLFDLPEERKSQNMMLLKGAMTAGMLGITPSIGLPQGITPFDRKFFGPERMKKIDPLLSEANPPRPITTDVLKQLGEKTNLGTFRDMLSLEDQYELMSDFRKSGLKGEHFYSLLDMPVHVSPIPMGKTNASYIQPGTYKDYPKGLTLINARKSGRISLSKSSIHELAHHMWGEGLKKPFTPALKRKEILDKGGDYYSLPDEEFAEMAARRWYARRDKHWMGFNEDKRLNPEGLDYKKISDESTKEYIREVFPREARELGYFEGIDDLSYREKMRRIFNKK